MGLGNLSNLLEDFSHNASPSWGIKYFVIVITSSIYTNCTRIVLELAGFCVLKFAMRG
jgi:hypothetical protein